jgi:hypothetical protein
MKAKENSHFPTVKLSVPEANSLRNQFPCFLNIVDNLATLFKDPV